jgi:sporulation protein YqfC
MPVNKSVTVSKRGKRAMKRGAFLASCGIPADSACAVPAVFLTGDRYIRVEHHRGVLLLTPTLIRLCSPLGVIRIEGSGLAAASMDGDVLLLDGRVRSVSFE